MAATAVQETKKPNMCLQSARVIRILKIIISYPVSVKINFLFQRNSFEWYLKKKKKKNMIIAWHLVTFDFTQTGELI